LHRKVIMKTFQIDLFDVLVDRVRPGNTMVDGPG
jgi:hypothetical protein